MDGQKVGLTSQKTVGARGQTTEDTIVTPERVFSPDRRTSLRVRVGRLRSGVTPTTIGRTPRVSGTRGTGHVTTTIGS